MIIGLLDWMQTPAGRYLLAWEQAQIDAHVSDVFGFNALQLGLPAMDALRHNRMRNRWLAVERPVLATSAAQASAMPTLVRPALHCDFDALPFPSQSLDLVVLPHALELASDPHQTLREVERVLMPEGRVVIVGFNPASLWSLRQRAGRLHRGIGFARSKPLFLPPGGDFIGYWRLRDWLRLLSFEVERGRFGCYRPPFASEAWLARFGWMESWGYRWWPVFGAVYFLVAVKRVRGMRLIGLAKRERSKAHAAPAVVANRRRERHLSIEQDDKGISR